MQLSEINAAIVTGAGSGMGAAMAARLADHDIKVICIDSNNDAAHQTAKAINGYPLAADVANSTQIEQGVASAIDSVGSVQACINCAGIAPAARTLGREGPMSLEAFNQTIQVNLIGTFNVARVAAHHMSSQDPINTDNERGVIINTASIAAFDGQIGQAAYSASKGAVVAMTLPLAREFARVGIRVMSIAPGLIDTPMMQSFPEDVQTSLAETVPFPKRLGSKIEYVNLAMHIIQNTYLNAEVIRMDGAIRLQAK